MKRALWRFCGVAAVLAAIPAAIAVASEGKQVDGAVYFGNAGSQRAVVSFQVSAHGTAVLAFNAGNLAPLCTIAESSPKFPASIRISAGTFTGNAVLPAGSKNSETVTGRFLANGRVTGTIDGAIQCLRPPNFNSGPVTTYHATWSALSEPEGKTSRYCYDDVIPTGRLSGIDITQIVAFRTPCTAVDKALNAGTFAAFPAREFTTAGWACKSVGATGRPRYSCTKDGSRFTFTKFG